MGEAFFYHLTRHSLDETLPLLLGKSLEAGWRVAIKGVRRERLEWLDQKLWLGPDDGFLPHGLEGGPHDADQPILLTMAEAPANKPDCILSIDGADITADQVGALTRTMILFDGTDPEAVQHARVQWKTLTDAGCPAKYWSEESGRWQMKAEKNT
ncbi:DNA polymerase III subunit chi [Pseudoprimorskyibacter insulae]|uniref:DNA polymerase III subunit chi n=1 Tax=Pseudoprimorskyibacter insulae TaxID=1695997 RepID=A0A2R8AVX0_9RHOB|nr:DNA polymerase III subunit chi [Pseudoprimorskyibacter insulae]SPF80182.1 hypothetical protein PRI8871_01988 [Pseudoprimorskyibacter insulae]